MEKMKWTQIKHLHKQAPEFFPRSYAEFRLVKVYHHRGTYILTMPHAQDKKVLVVSLYVLPWRRFLLPLNPLKSLMKMLFDTGTKQLIAHAENPITARLLTKLGFEPQRNLWYVLKRDTKGEQE